MSGGPPGSKDVVKGCLSLTQTRCLSSSRGTCPLRAQALVLSAGQASLVPDPEIYSIRRAQRRSWPHPAKPCDQQMARAWQQA